MNPATIGPFQILRELGRGGMGEVFLARDTRLDRQVAIKSLPAHLATDPDRLARFQREAKVLASLNHSNIGAIYGLEEAGGHQYLILEFIEGETLADRLVTGPLQVDEALNFAKQIAEALEVAHEKGIVHRDLKPGNVMITPDGVIKVLDFGLARTEDGAVSTTTGPALGDSPTVTSPVRLHSPTIPGVIMGTAGYMSPEQARGKAVDKRSDIFSFGCVLYEMLSGAQPFRGETVADAIGATLHKELDFGLLPPATPPTVRLLLSRCLAKDRKQRLHDIADARIELMQGISDPMGTSLGLNNVGLQQESRSRGQRTAVMLMLAAIALVGGTFPLWSSRVGLGGGKAQVSAPKPVVRFTVEPPAGYTLPQFISSGSAIAISPAGDRIVFAVEADNKPYLCTRDIAEGQARLLADSKDCHSAFFSPDGKWLGYVSNGRLMKMPANGGPSLTICELGNFNSFSWLEDGTIVWGAGTSGLWRVSADGGNATQLAKVGKEAKTKEPGLKVFGLDTPLAVPGADYILACGWDGFTTEDYRLYAVSLTDGTISLLLRTATEPRLIAPDRLLFTRGTTVMTVGFDPVHGAIVGEPTVALEKVRTDLWMDSAYIGTSISGTFASVPGGRFGADRRIVRVDETGKSVPMLDALDCYQQIPMLSRDGRKAILMTLRQKPEMWVLDLERKSMSLITSDGEAFGPKWSADGTSIFAGLTQPGGAACIAKWPAGGGKHTVLPGTSGMIANVEQVLPDGSGLLLSLNIVEATGKSDIAVYDFAKESITPVRNGPASEWLSAVSPDGKWIAYTSNESGRDQIYLGPLGASGPNVQVSSNGGFCPAFSRDGKRLFFFNEEKFMMVSTIDIGGTEASVSEPKVLFDTKGSNLKPGYTTKGFDVLPEGGFVMFEKAAWEKEPPVIHVILNWAEELRVKGTVSK